MKQVRREPRLALQRLWGEVIAEAGYSRRLTLFPLLVPPLLAFPRSFVFPRQQTDSDLRITTLSLGRVSGSNSADEIISVSPRPQKKSSPRKKKKRRVLPCNCAPSDGATMVAVVPPYQQMGRQPQLPGLLIKRETSAH